MALASHLELAVFVVDDDDAIRDAFIDYPREKPFFGDATKFHREARAARPKLVHAERSSQIPVLRRIIRVLRMQAKRGGIGDVGKTKGVSGEKPDDQIIDRAA